MQRRGGALPLPEDPRNHFPSLDLRLAQPLQGYMMERHRPTFHPVYGRGARLTGVQASFQCVDAPPSMNVNFGKGGHQEHYVIVSEPSFGLGYYLTEPQSLP